MGGVLTVVGTLALDTLARVKRLPEPEETAGVLDVRPEVPGGTAGNVAVALARLGLPPRVLAGVGPDFAGSAYERLLEELKVDLSALVRSPLPTSRCYIFFEDSGRQISHFYGGASHAFSEGAPSVSGRVHFAAGEISAYPRLMEQAEWVSFDPGQETFHRDLDQILACLPHVDVLFLNRFERERLESAAGLGVDRLLVDGLETVVESRGAEGTIVHTHEGALAVPAVPVVARDPTGGGDAHRAGFLYAWERRADALAAARFANVLGSFAVEHVGAQDGLPTLDEALQRYEKAYGEKAPFAQRA